jgi:phosphoribosylformylglycinamidine synthase
VKGVKRVERAIRFTVCSSGASAFPTCFEEVKPALPALFDRMTEGVYLDLDDLFDVLPPQPGREFDVLGRGIDAIREANIELGLAISEPEMKYLADSFKAAKRNPTDTELVMFGQVNSEHCRHKIFGAEFIIDGKSQKDSLFGMIKNTHKKNGKGTLVA